MATARSRKDGGGPDPAPQAPEQPAGQPPAWEQIESGRYRPRRIRGSCPGRELG